MVLCICLRLLVFLILFLEVATAGSVTEGSPCSLSNDKIDLSTHKFTSDCDDRAFCHPILAPNSTDVAVNSTKDSGTTKLSGVCVKRRCRRDEFPFGFAPDEPLPQICPRGFFCPDSGSGCQPMLSVGAPCDMDRDYQCAPPKKWYLTASEWNVNGSVCLQSTCIYANVTIGLPCILESTSYFGYNRDNAPYNISVARDNCLSSWPKLYCSPASRLCEKMKDLGVQCESDRECLSQSCNSHAKVCSEPPGLPTKVKSWQYGLTVMSVLGAVTAICVFLTLTHKRQRLERYYELLEYYHEQTRHVLFPVEVAAYFDLSSSKSPSVHHFLARSSSGETWEREDALLMKVSH